MKRGTGRTAAVVAGFGAAAGLVMGMAPAASADQGDGYVICNRGEICFKEWAHDSGGPGRRHFYWNDSNHHDDSWHKGGAFWDDATYILNRDTQCSVRVHEHVGYGGYQQTFLPKPGNEDYPVNYEHFLPGLYEKNSAHQRIC
ncbi:hypothetical protein [Streptomyces atacamensis]|uniref:hypothetical protein n=1 Tax=Streptomyces atacamensis TaxID=531966 RepID=UPI00399D07E6